MGFLNDSRKKTEAVKVKVIVRIRCMVMFMVRGMVMVMFKGRGRCMVMFMVRGMVMVMGRVTAENRTLRKKMSFNKVFLMGSIKNKQPVQSKEGNLILKFTVKTWDKEGKEFIGLS